MYPHVILSLSLITMCTHARWVYAPPQSCDMYNRSHAPRYLQLCLPFHVLQTLARFRIGWHKLAVHSGRMARPPVPRAQRMCRLCCGNDSRQQWRDRIHERVGSHSCVEDLKHFVLECARQSAVYCCIVSLAAGLWHTLGSCQLWHCGTGLLPGAGPSRLIGWFLLWKRMCR